MMKHLAAKIRVDPSGCHLWTGAVNPDGYGLVRRDGKLWRVHRLVYTLEVGPIPKGLSLDHRCHSMPGTLCIGGNACMHRRCVNPKHLEAVTHSENVKRKNYPQQQLRDTNLRLYKKATGLTCVEEKKSYTPQAPTEHFSPRDAFACLHQRRQRPRALDNYIPEPNSGCWLWLGMVNHDGYAMLTGRKRAHRVMYEREVGPIPKGLQLDHLCFVRSCVNPAHLKLATSEENLRHRRFGPKEVVPRLTPARPYRRRAR